MFSSSRSLISNGRRIRLKRGQPGRNGLGGVRRWGRREFTVLALESSADDTCAAVVTSEREVLANVVLNQADRYVLAPPLGVTVEWPAWILNVNSFFKA